MITANDLARVEQFQDVCAYHHLEYRIDGQYVVVRVDHKFYPSFSETNNIFRARTVDEALSFVTGLVSMFGEVMRKDLAEKEKP